MPLTTAGVIAGAEVRVPAAGACRQVGPDRRSASSVLGAVTRTGIMIRTPDQRVRVFVSSTLGELAAEREAVSAAIRQLRLTPALTLTGDGFVLLANEDQAGAQVLFDQSLPLYR